MILFELIYGLIVQNKSELGYNYPLATQSTRVRDLVSNTWDCSGQHLHTTTHTYVTVSLRAGQIMSCLNTPCKHYKSSFSVQVISPKSFGREAKSWEWEGRKERTGNGSSSPTISQLGMSLATIPRMCSLLAVASLQQRVSFVIVFRYCYFVPIAIYPHSPVLPSVSSFPLDFFPYLNLSLSKSFLPSVPLITLGLCRYPPSLSLLI